MHLAVLGVGVSEVFLHVLRQQVAPVAGGVDQHIGCSGRHRTIEDGLERLVAGLAVFKAQVVAEDDEFLGPRGHHIHDVGQIGQIRLVHLDQAQTLRRVGIQAGLDERGLAGAACAGQQHVVGGQASHKLLRVALDLFLLGVDFLEVRQRHRGHMAHRLQGAVAAAALAVAPGNGRRPVGRRKRLGQHGFDAGDELLGTLDQMFKFLVHFGIYRASIMR